MTDFSLWCYAMSAVCFSFLLLLVMGDLISNLRDLRKGFVKSMRALFRRTQ
jgi:hypothetical protein